jgi:hypothetical protein
VKGIAIATTTAGGNARYMDEVLMRNMPIPYPIHDTISMKTPAPSKHCGFKSFEHDVFFRVGYFQIIRITNQRHGFFISGVFEKKMVGNGKRKIINGETLQGSHTRTLHIRTSGY